MSVDWFTVAVAVPSVALYVVIGGFVGALTERDERLEPLCVAAGAFWPLVLPVAIVAFVGQRLVMLGAWLGRERPPRVSLPKAQVRK